MVFSKKVRKKYISALTKPKFQLSLVKESYRQNINYDDWLMNIKPQQI